MLSLALLLMMPALALASDERAKAALVESYGKLPLSFEANEGQTAPQARFLSRGPGYTFFLKQRGDAVLALHPAMPLKPGAKKTEQSAAQGAVIEMALRAGGFSRASRQN